MRVNLSRENYQQYICPEEYQQRLTEAGGVNKYDEPNFKLVWSQGGDEHSVYRAGGIWETENCPSYMGYRDLLIGGGVPCWALLQWHKAEEYGTPELYYVLNYDLESGLQTLGEYPYSGRYQLLYNLRYMEKTPQGLNFEAMPLNDNLIETIIPILTMAKDVSWEKTKAAMEDLKEKDDRAEVSRIEDVMRSNSVPFSGNAVSYTKQGSTSSKVGKKMEQMLRHWNEITRKAKALDKGLTVPTLSDPIVQQELRKKAQ